MSTLLERVEALTPGQRSYLLFWLAAAGPDTDDGQAIERGLAHLAESERRHATPPALKAEVCRRCGLELMDGECPECATCMVTFLACGDQISDTELVAPGTPMHCPRHGETIAITSEQWLAEHPPELSRDLSGDLDAIPANRIDPGSECAACGSAVDLVAVHDTGGDGSVLYYCDNREACQRRRLARTKDVTS